MRAELLSGRPGLSAAAAADSCNRNQLGWTAGAEQEGFPGWEAKKEAGALMRWKS